MAKKEFKLTKTNLKKAGKELEEILEPTDDDGNSTPIVLDDIEKMKEKIIEAGTCLTPDDGISKNLQNVLNALEVTIKEETEQEIEEEKEKALTWDDIKVMGKIELKALCEDKELITDSDDYEKLKDFRIEVAIELGLDVPENENEKEETTKVINLNEIVQKTKKLADLKDIVLNKDIFKPLKKGLDEFKGLSGPKQLKAKMLAILDLDAINDSKNVKEAKETEKPKNTESNKKGKEVKSKSENKREKIQKEVKNNKQEVAIINKSKYNRITSVSDTISKLGKNGFTIKDAQNKSDELYSKKTGNKKFDTDSKKMHPATHIVNYMISGLVSFNVLEKTDKTYKFIK